MSSHKKHKSSPITRERSGRSKAQCSADDHGDDFFALGRDVALDILLRLPLKSLCRFMCVSKRWLGVISNPAFAELKSTTSITISGVLNPRPCTLMTKQIIFIPDRISEEATAINEAMNSMKIDGKGVHILDSHKGFLLCCEDDSSQMKHYYVCDTLTKHYLSLTIPSESRNRPKITKLYCEGDRFNIIQLSYCRKFKVQTFYMERGKWKVDELVLPLPIEKFPRHIPTLLGNTIFWIHDDRESMCAYNIEEERLYELPMPSDTKAIEGCLSASSGALYYAEMTFHNSELNIWVLEKGDQLSGRKNVTWELRHKMDIIAIFEANINKIRGPMPIDKAYTIQFIPMAFHHGNPNIMFVKLRPWKFAVFDIGKGKVRGICDEEDEWVGGGYGGRGLGFGRHCEWVCPFEQPAWPSKMLALCNAPLSKY